MSGAIGVAKQALQQATPRLPAAFAFPLGGILGRLAMGLALLAAGIALILFQGVLWVVAGALLALAGGTAACSNLCALLDADRRRVVLDQEGVEIRYGFSRRRYPFLDYSDYRIARVGVRRFLTALPVELDRSRRRPVERLRVTIHDRPAVLAPMPLLGRGAPTTLLEWQATLNALRQAAIVAAAGSALQPGDGCTEESAAATHRAARWRKRAEDGAGSSRLSRRAYVRGRWILALVFLVILLGPTAFVLAIGQGLVALCGSTVETGCLSVDPMLERAATIGAPLLGVLVFVLGSARLTVRRAHDLDEEMTFRHAVLCSLGGYGRWQRRLSREEGTRGPNRFGPVPPA